jgi:hypothetical protein
MTLLGTFLFTIWSMLPSSEILWNAISPLGHVQYPWRFLAVASLIGAWLSTWLVAQKRQPIQSFMLGLVLIGLALINVRNYAQTYTYVRYQDSDFLSWQGLIGGSTDISWELLPSGITTAPTEPRIQYVQSENPNAKITYSVNKTASTHFSLELESSANETITLGTLLYPAWQVSLNKQPAQLRASENGLIELALPQGKSSIEVQLIKTPVEIIGDVLSSASMGTLGLLLGWHAYSCHFSKRAYT